MAEAVSTGPEHIRRMERRDDEQAIPRKMLSSTPALHERQEYIWVISSRLRRLMTTQMCPNSCTTYRADSRKSIKASLF